MPQRSPLPVFVRTAGTPTRMQRRDSRAVSRADYGSAVALAVSLAVSTAVALAVATTVRSAFVVGPNRSADAIAGLNKSECRAGLVRPEHGTVSHPDHRPYRAADSSSDRYALSRTDRRPKCRAFHAPNDIAPDSPPHVPSNRRADGQSDRREPDAAVHVRDLRRWTLRRRVLPRDGRGVLRRMHHRVAHHR